MKKLILVLIFCLLPVFAFSAEITITWRAGIETDLAEYRLYETFNSGEYMFGDGNQVETIPAGTETVTFFVPDEDVDLLYWLLTAVDTDGLESEPSNEVCLEEDIPDTPSNGGGKGGCFIITIKVRRGK